MALADILAGGDNLGYGGDIERKLRAKVALGLMQQGTSAAPAQHWTQGLARLAQALSGGVMAGQIGAEEGRDEAQAAAERTIPGQVGPEPASIMPPPTMGPRPRTAAALAGEPPEPTAPTPYQLNPGLAPRNSQDTFRAPLDTMRPSQDAIRTAYAGAGQPPSPLAMSNSTPAGAIPVQTQAITPPGPQVAQATSAGPPVVGGPTAVMPSQYDPAYINTLLRSRNKENRLYGEKLYQAALARGKEQVTQKVDANGVPYQELGTGERKADPTRPEYNVHYLPNGTIMAVNKSNPRDTHVIDSKQAQNIIDFDAQKAGAVETAQGRAKQAVTKEGQKEGKLQSGRIVLDNIAQAQNQIEKGYFTTGLTGSVSAMVPGTAAHDLSQTLDTIKANIGFDKLNEMRAASPTGGALGSVSDFENRLLQSTLGSIRQSQGTEQLQANLKKLQLLYTTIINEGVKPPPGWTPDKPVLPGETPPKAAPQQSAPRQAAPARSPANFDRAKAKAAGYSDAEIDAFLGGGSM